MQRLIGIALGLLFCMACGNDTPVAPAPPATPPTPTRIIRLSGTLNFGTVQPNAQPADQTFTIFNDGNATLAVSGMRAPCGGSSVNVIGSVSFSVLSGLSIPIRVRFRPTIAQDCSGTFTITSDATSGDGTLPITAVSAGDPIPPPPPPAPSVEYRITGSARHCSSTYENSTGGVNQHGVNIPFSYSWNGARSGDFLYMSCQIDQASDTGSITVAIYKNGTLYRSGFASGFPNIATASGSY